METKNAGALFFEVTKKDGITVADSNLQDLASQSACIRVSRQLDNQVPATDNETHHLLDSSQKNRFTLKKTFHYIPLQKTTLCGVDGISM